MVDEIWGSRVGVGKVSIRNNESTAHFRYIVVYINYVQIRCLFFNDICANMRYEKANGMLWNAMHVVFQAAESPYLGSLRRRLLSGIAFAAGLKQIIFLDQLDLDFGVAPGKDDCEAPPPFGSSFPKKRRSSCGSCGSCGGLGVVVVVAFNHESC